MNLRLVQRICVLFIITTLIFSTLAFSTTGVTATEEVVAKEEEEEKNNKDNVEKWLDEINRINIPKLSAQENSGLRNLLGGYLGVARDIGTAGMFYYYTNINNNKNDRFASDYQFKPSFLFDALSAILIVADDYRLENLRKFRISLQKLLEKHIDKSDSINIEYTKELLTNLDKIFNKAEYLLEKGQNNTDKFMKKVNEFKSIQERQKFINANLPPYIIKVQNKRDSINLEIKNLIISVNKLLNKIKPKIKVCHNNKKECESRGIGHIFLAAANIYGSYVTYNLGNVAFVGIHAALASCNIMIAKWEYDEYCKINEALVKLKTIFNHYKKLHKTISEQETKVLADFTIFINSILKEAEEKEEEADMDFDWDQE
jgi:hypothetical protein